MKMPYEVKEATFLLRTKCNDLSDAVKYSPIKSSTLAQHCASLTRCIAATNYAIWGGLSRGSAGEKAIVADKLEALGLFIDELDRLLVDARYAYKHFRNYKGNNWGTSITLIGTLIAEVRKGIVAVLRFGAPCVQELDLFSVMQASKTEVAA